jgi:hypothetical protein
MPKVTVDEHRHLPGAVGKVGATNDIARVQSIADTTRV